VIVFFIELHLFHTPSMDPHGDESRHNRPYSIDLTLELEHQLENDAFPPALTHPSNLSRQSLDPNILASLIIQLRHSLAEVTGERDELLHRLSEARNQETSLTDTLRDVSEKCTRLQDELEAAKQKAKDDEDAITMLRAKVEESRLVLTCIPIHASHPHGCRRGVMRLQSENRRMSQGPLTPDISRTVSAKRASFTPLTGMAAVRPNGHRRISSVSDSGWADPESFKEAMNFSGLQGLISPDSQQITSNSNRPSALSRYSPSPLESAHDTTPSEVAALRRELASVKGELEEAQHALSESNEAREASETCVKALREFIGQNNIGGLSTPGPIKLPLPPTMTTGEEAELKKSNTGWRFKLWTAESSVKHVSNDLPPPLATPTPTLSRTLGGFFGSRASLTSVMSQAGPGQPSSKATRQGSDCSSVAESLPEIISTTGDGSGLGVVVPGSLSSLSELGRSADQIGHEGDNLS
jgi:hypothetical protein